MTLSKKHYKAIAEIIGKSDTCTQLIENLCTYFKNDNPRFNKETFKKAIEIAEIKHWT